MGQPNRRFERGKEAINQVYGDGAADVFLTRRAGLGEDLVWFGLEFNFGDVNGRPGIDLATRTVVRATLAEKGVDVSLPDPPLPGVS